MLGRFPGSQQQNCRQNLTRWCQARIQDFGEGALPSFDAKEGLSPQFAQNRVFRLKLPENCMILKKSWVKGVGGGSGRGGFGFTGSFSVGNNAEADSGPGPETPF